DEEREERKTLQRVADRLLEALIEHHERDEETCQPQRAQEPLPGALAQACRVERGVAEDAKHAAEEDRVDPRVARDVGAVLRRSQREDQDDSPCEYHAAEREERRGLTPGRRG